MEIFDELGSSERILSYRAASMRIPLGGTFELLPVCNMDCQMCYIRSNPTKVKEEGGLLSADEWIRIAQEARDAGMLYLLLTGGEPLLYPEFEELYSWLGTNGLVVALNTNGTLIKEETADLLLKYPPRKVNISLYGASDDTYYELCGNSKGFTNVMNGIKLLLEKKIPVKLNCSLTPNNVKDLPMMHEIADILHIPLQVTPYMYPPVRKEGVDIEKFSRFTPKEAAEMVIFNAKLVNDPDNMYIKWIESKLYSYYKNCEKPVNYGTCGITCYATKNNFWINWKGEMLPCGMMNSPAYSVRTNSFSAAWNNIVKAGKSIKNSIPCSTCKKRPLCNVCSAAAKAETGYLEGTPEYLCEMTDRLIELLEMESKNAQK